MSNPFFTAFSNADLFGKLIFYSLFILSILSWCIIIQRLRMQKQAHRHSQLFDRRFADIESNPLALDLRAGPSINPFLSIYQGLRHLALRILEKNRRHTTDSQSFLSSADMDFVSSQVDNLIARQSKQLGKHLFILGTIVTLAPFLGLLGTVWGSLMTLSALRDHHTLTGNSVVLEGLSMALATTVLGLLVAIPALIGHAMLRARARDLARQSRDFSVRVLTAIEMQYRKVDP